MKKSGDDEFLVALSAFVAFGPARINLLLSYFGSAKRVWESSKDKLLELGLSLKKVSDFIEHRNEFNKEEYFDRLKRLEIKYTTKNHKDYPSNLKNISDAPFVLYYKGNISSSDSNSVAIVGTRKMTSYGKEVTERFSSELASFGVSIISGLARGIDTIAHKSALLAGGRTLAVLGCGLDSIYPPENFKLAREIISTGGVIFSEYPIGYPALPINFAARNRIISGLSKVVLIIEGAEKSGTLLTASHAAEQGREVFAIPGQITSPLSFAPLYLLKNGAKMATDAKDILDELGLQINVDREKIEKVMPKGKDEEEILSILENEEMHLDEIARASSLNVSDVSARLTIMELKGLVKNMGKGMFKKT